MDKKLAMKKRAITDVVVNPLRVIEDERGVVLHMLREDSAILANCSDIPHDPSESQQVDVNKKGIGYVW